MVDKISCRDMFTGKFVKLFFELVSGRKPEDDADRRTLERYFKSLSTAIPSFRKC